MQSAAMSRQVSGRQPLLPRPEREKIRPVPISNPTLTQQKLVFWTAVLLLVAATVAWYATTPRLIALSAGLALGVALSVIALVWLFAVRNREAARRRQAEADLKALNAELEDHIRERTAELERSRDLLDAVIENMPDSFFLKDVENDYRCVLTNSAGEALFGRSRHQLLGRTDADLLMADHAAMSSREDRDVIASGRHKLVVDRLVETPQGMRTVETRKVPIPDGEGSYRYLLEIVRDTTEHKALENRLRQAQRMDAVGRLTGGIAHDFNNILAIVIGNLDLLREQLAEASDDAAMADEALAAATHGAELVRRLLAFARKQHLEPVSVDLNERLPSTTALLRRALGEDIKLQVHAAAGLWPALVDPTQVDDALVNLAINARDAMPGGGSLTIETGNFVLDEEYAAQNVEVVPGEYVMLAVSDTGTGMPAEVIARAFEPFYTTKPEGKGTGLGLSQVYGWIKQSGGHIKIYSEVGHGTTIKLYLPRAGEPQAEAGKSPADGSEAPRGDERIFVVEDNPSVRSTVRRQLKELGYQTIEAADGRTALAMAGDGAEFDLLFTDVVMPGGMTGYELVEKMAELRPDLRVLFTSGYTELAVGNGHSAKAGPLLSKPYRKQDLGRALRSVLDSDG
jgi:PAS domain S-box-containing protein